MKNFECCLNNSDVFEDVLGIYQVSEQEQAEEVVRCEQGQELSLFFKVPDGVGGYWNQGWSQDCGN